MVYRQLFLDAIADALNGTEYRLVNNSFYIYKREVGIIIIVTFDTYWNVSGFRIYGGASAFCDQIELSSNGQLGIHCYDLNDYASHCGLPKIDNDNPLSEPFGRPKRYTKVLLVEKLQQNMELFRKSLLADLLEIESMEDYYNFEVKAGGIRYSVAIPFPSIDAFFLCIFLGKFKEAGHIYLRFLKNMHYYYSIIEKINDSMNLASAYVIINALDGIDTQENSNKDSFIRFEKEAEMVENILRKHEAALMEEVQNRINKSRIICDRFFAEK